MKKALVCGAGGFIGGHMVKRLKSEGYWVLGVDLKRHDFTELPADEFILGDLCNPQFVSEIIDSGMDEVYQFAADMGGAGYIFTGDNDADVMHNSACCNLNIVDEAVRKCVGKIFYSSSACVYPEAIQKDPNNPGLQEHMAYPASPDSEYGWEKLFSERMYLAYHRNHGLDVRIARLHNIFGPEGTWTGGREKAPAAMCRKVAEAGPGGEIEVWGDGKQTRSFLYIDQCIEGIRRLMNSEFKGPVNIGSDEMVAINDLALMAAQIAGYHIEIRNVPGPLGVRGRNSDNTLIAEKVGWSPAQSLREGMQNTYEWIASQVAASVANETGSA
jgi:nucleoside-diphosphate-sugar epimerase